MTPDWSKRRHRGALLGLTLAFAALPAHAQAPGLPETPQSLFPGLYEAVEMQRVFPDSKVFADAVPRSAPADILEQYRRSSPASGELRRFVVEHFSLPEESAPGPASPAASAAPSPASLAAHIDALWGALTRRSPSTPPFASLLPLPDPYVVPGGRFREMYYWDSYFTMLGLADSGRMDLVRDMVRDFAALIDRYGHVPNGTRSYYLSRSQPPFFFAMVALLEPRAPAAADARYLPELRREYAFWMEGAADLRSGDAHRRVVALSNGAVLNRYWDDADTPRDESYSEDRALAARSGREAAILYRDVRAAAESGWDFSSRWFADGQHLESIRTTELIPVDLNSLLYGLESAIAAGCARIADRGCVREFRDRARTRRAAMDRFLWDAAAGAYRDYDWVHAVRVPRLSAATLYPLFVGAASQAQARAVGATIRVSLLQPGGIAATAGRTGQQWDAPNGWAPLQWVAISGLRRYDIMDLAHLIAARWLHTVARVYGSTGRLMEKYDVTDPERPGGGGEYPLQDGFGWTNGVTRRLMKLYPRELPAGAGRG